MTFDVAQAFDWAALRRFSAVEVDPSRSHQHEVSAGSLRRHLVTAGVVDDRADEARIDATWMLLDDDEAPLTVDESMLLYDSRRNTPGRAPEWRMYYAAGGLVESIVHAHVRPGDLLVFATPVTSSPDVCLLVAPSGSQWERTLLSIFPLAPTQPRLAVVDPDSLRNAQDRAAARLIADLLDLPVHTTSDADWLSAELGDLAHVAFPDTRTMAQLAEKRLGPWDGHDPDTRLTDLLDAETRLFHALENAQALPRFRDDCATTDDYLTLAKSLLQRRRSRRGYSFEHHLATVLDGSGLKFETQVETEPSSRVDFLFPDLATYVAGGVNLDDRVVHMNAKSTSRERWKQVLHEASRLERRHLGTLDPSISSATVRAAAAAGVTIVVPRPLRDLYDEDAQQALWTVADFVSHVAATQ